MFSNKTIFKVLAILATVTLIASCSESKVSKAEIQNYKQQTVAFDVYKSPTCGCCNKWISHLDDNGFQSRVHNRRNSSAIKEEKGIEPRYRSCHTAISKEGFIFEGHIPVKFIQQFLKESHPNDVLGLSVPAMPVGSPGMEVGDKFQPYSVLLLNSDGTYEIYATIQSQKEQF